MFKISVRKIFLRAFIMKQFVRWARLLDPLISMDRLTDKSPVICLVTSWRTMQAKQWIKKVRSTRNRLQRREGRRVTV